MTLKEWRRIYRVLCFWPGVRFLLLLWTSHFSKCLLRAWPVRVRKSVQFPWCHRRCQILIPWSNLGFTAPPLRVLRELDTAPYPPPLKMYGEGGGGREFFIHFPPLPLTRVFIVLTFLGKIKRLPTEVGGALHTFSVFGFKSLFRKRWGEGFIHWFCKAMDLWCSWSFPGESYEIAWRFWGPSLPLKSKFASPPWVNTFIIPKFGGGGIEMERGWKSTDGHRQFLKLKQHSPPYFHTFPVFCRNHLVPPKSYTYLILFHLIQSTAVHEHGPCPLCFIHFKIFNLQWIDSS